MENPANDHRDFLQGMEDPKNFIEGLMASAAIGSS